MTDIDLLVRFRAEQQERNERITRGLAAAEVVLPTLDPVETLSVMDFLDRLCVAGNIDRATAQEIMHHLDITHQIEEILVKPDNPNDPHIRIGAMSDADHKRLTAEDLAKYGPPEPSTQDDLFSPEADFINKYACACCGYYTMDQPPSGSYELCPVCYWEDDPRQTKDPNFFGGANVPSLNHSRLAYKRYGAMAANLRYYVRAPKPEEKPEYRHLLGLPT